MPPIMQATLALASFCISVLASPAAAATSCQTTTTYRANFDHVATNTPVPSSVGNVVWTDFTVTDLTGTNLLPKSGSNVATTPSYGASISQSPALLALFSPQYPEVLEFEIQSFTFGCTLPLLHSDNATACSVSIVTETYTDYDTGVEFPIGYYGPFAFGADACGASGCTLTKVVLGEAARIFRFFLTAGTGGSVVYFDNFVIVNTNPSCSG